VDVARLYVTFSLAWCGEQVS